MGSERRVSSQFSTPSIVGGAVRRARHPRSADHRRPRRRSESRRMDVLTTPLLTGTATGAILLLAALGLTLTFGQMGVINMANGEFLMVGAYAAYMTQQVISGPGLSTAGRAPGRLPARRPAGPAPGGLRHPMDVQAAARHAARDGRRVPGAAAARARRLRRAGRPGHRAELARRPHLGVRLRVAAPPALHDRAGGRLARRAQRSPEVQLVRSSDPGDGAEPRARRDAGRRDTNVSTGSPSSWAPAWQVSAGSPSR